MSSQTDSPPLDGTIPSRTAEFVVPAFGYGNDVISG